MKQRYVSDVTQRISRPLCAQLSHGKRSPTLRPLPSALCRPAPRHPFCPSGSTARNPDQTTRDGLSPFSPPPLFPRGRRVAKSHRGPPVGCFGVTARQSGARVHPKEGRERELRVRGDSAHHDQENVRRGRSHQVQQENASCHACRHRGRGEERRRTQNDFIFMLFVV